MSKADNFPTAVSMQKCVGRGQCAPSLVEFLARTAGMTLGLTLAGASHPVPKALAASAAVSAFVAAWVVTHGNARLPSGVAATNGDVAGLVYTYLARSAIAGTGLALSGQSDRLVLDSLAAVAPIELAVILWSQT